MALWDRTLRAASRRGNDGTARYSARIVRIAHLPALATALALAAGLAACGGSGPNAADTVAQPPLTSTQPPTTGTPATTTTSTSTVTTPGTTTQPATATQTATAPAPTQTSTDGATGGAQAGCPNAVGGFIRDVQARGTDCGRARDVASAWFAAVHGGADPTSQVTASGYACSGAMSGERASVSCSGGGGSISFTASP